MLTVYIKFNCLCRYLFSSYVLLLHLPHDSRTLEIPLPSLEWWELFDSTAEDIQAITQEIIHLYQRTKLTWLPDLTETSLFDFSSYENVIIPSPEKISLKQQYFYIQLFTNRIKVKVDLNNPQEQKKEMNENTTIRQPSRSHSHHHDHHSRRRSRSHSHRRNHSHRRSRSHDRDRHSHRRHRH